MLHADRFVEPDLACNDILSEVKNLAESMGIKARKSFKLVEDRHVFFLDTVDFAIRRNSFALRIRESNGEFEYTAKCRSPDRYIARRELKASAAAEKPPKFEEDIAAPFRGRFSHSVKLAVPISSTLTDTLGATSELFGVFEEIEHNDLPCPPDTSLQRVNASTFREQVYAGPKLEIAGRKTEIAVILWFSRHQDGPIVAEFSFRYKDKQEHYAFKLAVLAKRFFREIQELDWCNPNGATKTQFAYGEI